MMRKPKADSSRQNVPVVDVSGRRGEPSSKELNSGARRLTTAEFQHLADVPPEAEWFANIDSAQTRRAYKNDIREFMAFTGIEAAGEFREVTRAHVIAWRKDLEVRELAGATIRRKLAALSSLFDHLTECNAVEMNPVKGVKRPKVESYEGKTPALSDDQARALLLAPDPETLKGKRDRAILSVFLFHGLRREEVATLQVKDIFEIRGVKHLRVHGKGGKLRNVPLHPATTQLIDQYLELAGHGDDSDGGIFRSIRETVRSGNVRSGLSAEGLYLIVTTWAKAVGISAARVAPHALRATAATNALENEADIAKVQEWLGHANISTTRIYDRRKLRPEDSPTFKVNY
ncbi:MAG: tyrosine-type recombinase/integrase [Burkholderiaceae bacterium]